MNGDDDTEIVKRQSVSELARPGNASAAAGAFPPEEFVDRDGATRALGVATPTRNRRAYAFRGRPCTSRFKGVFFDQRRGNWVATIKKDRVQRRLGTFRDEIAAAQAYDEAARELFGEHARLNFPEGVDCWLEHKAAR